MKARALGLFLALALAASAHAQPTASGKQDLAATGGGGGGITNAAAADVVVKSDGTNVIGTNIREDSTLIKLGYPGLVSVRKDTGTMTISPSSPGTALTIRANTDTGWPQIEFQNRLGVRVSTIEADGHFNGVVDGSLNGSATSVASVAEGKLVGRNSTGGAGPSQDITLGTGLTMSGTTLNASGSGGSATPTGTVVAFLSAGFVPAGWLACDGSMVSSVDHPDLYAVIGTTFGDGGAGYFYLPNLKGMFLGGWDPALFRPPGPMGGAENSSHMHSLTIGVTNTATEVMPGEGSGVYAAGTDIAATGDTSYDGNLPPSFAVVWIIKT